MTKALLLLAWVPLLSVASPQPNKTEFPVTISCNAAWELMDIVNWEIGEVGTADL